MIAFLDPVKRRIESSCERMGLTYPWWIPAYCTLAVVALDVAAFVQRDPGRPSPAVIAGALMVLVPLGVWLTGGWLFPPWLDAVAIVVAVSLFLTHPVTPDFAPLLLLITAGEVAATAKPLIAMVVSAVDIGVLIVATQYHHLDGAALYVVGVILGADVGIALRWQMRALAAERRNTAIAQEQAILAERERLAREVHDVVGHTLSINLLHVTAARHALQQHGDVSDAVESLVEAERVGRDAMGDLRRTVAVLRAPTVETQPLPGIDDVPALIEQCRAAGLDIRYTWDSSPKGMSDLTGLGIYRIVQESLANIAKHAPRSSASVTMTLQDDALGVHIANTLPADHRTSPPGQGSGLPGMAARAQQMGADLRAGAADGQWVVTVTAPVASS